MRISKLIVIAASSRWAAAQFVSGVTAGVNPQTGERPARLNINDFHRQGGPAWELFIQALTAMYETPEDDWLSWFQIAGIHGLPFKSYMGIGEGIGNMKMGYCPHGQLTFTTWHRPYLALVEQTLHSHAERIARTYTGPSATTYLSAASTLRFPYWDWASDAQLPPIITTPTITINTPTAPNRTIPNPLYTYPFQTFPFTDPDMLPYDRFIHFNSTKRCTDVGPSSDGIHHYDVLSQTLGSIAAQVRDMTYDVFTKTARFADMASVSGNGSSFENPHNMIHMLAGGHPLVPSRAGHIQPAEWAAFDVLFFLHHANVDRLFAMWQALHTDEESRFTEDVFATGMAVYGSPAQRLTPDTPLKPFMRADGTFWTSRGVEGTRVFGYTYPGLEDWEYDGEELRRRVRGVVNELYGPRVGDGSAVTRRQEGGDGEVMQKDFAVGISVDRADLTVPCSIEVRIGDEVAGEYSLLSMPKTGLGGASIPLRRALEKAGVEVEGRRTEDVVRELKDKISLVVKEGDQQRETPGKEVKSLVVEIEERDFTPARTADEFPRYGEKSTCVAN
ncbi:tyrosinase [Podospora aff. communis PSN243]|uniref:Tyrosinase n=1 Tax=Podospora aff. communis PSN243 TaxID=3040156 RepID=A0AAV9G6Z5_9PEZI|nr:tyrosinase [Podospora aff. communis PSN243]